MAVDGTMAEEYAEELVLTVLEKVASISPSKDLPWMNPHRPCVDLVMDPREVLFPLPSWYPS